eukprot:5684642-Pleurochrysis_carterae.AAC.1
MRNALSVKERHVVGPSELQIKLQRRESACETASEIASEIASETASDRAGMLHQRVRMPCVSGGASGPAQGCSAAAARWR